MNDLVTYVTTVGTQDVIRLMENDNCPDSQIKNFLMISNTNPVEVFS